ncbi:CLIP domain-containing serine protease 14D-like [Homalodisca vitripennis]|uniref:CLIP domain-containing serine protease 14D-like n=1 Tax=Homalodisca vitripennis TaxID=197043 RepID=UPI001EEC4CE2|nr:CLIP domain-containing serine protease 14D-like [Homalodisca vitripennis]
MGFYYFQIPDDHGKTKQLFIMKPSPNSHSPDCDPILHESIFGSHTLLTVSVPVQSNVFCTEKYRGHTEIFSTQMCAGGEPGKDSCSGDSGGPLMKPFSINTSTRYFLIGIVSVGPKKCGVDPIPGIYTSVAKYITWILDNVYE